MIPISSLTRIAVTTLLSLLLLAACQRDSEHNAELFVFGTIVNINLWGVDDQLASSAFTDLQRQFQEMHRDWHAWEPGQLTRINQAFAEGQTATADPLMIAIIRRSQELETLTGARFNAAIGGLIGLWGFHTSDYPITGPPPTQNEIDRWVNQHPSSLDIKINGLQLHSDNPAVQLDFGGIGKGLAVDIAIEHLRSMGINNAIVNAGGDLRAIGSHGKRPWRVAIQKPGDGPVGYIDVKGDEAIFTSGSYIRFRQDKQQRYPHILDPRNGQPTQNIASVTVIGDEGVVADAAATAMVVAGLKDWPQVAQALGLSQVAVIDEQGTVFVTPAMARRIQFDEGVKMVLVDPNAFTTTHSDESDKTD